MQPTLTIHCADASCWTGQADLVFTHPYAPLPPQLVGVPALINLYLPPGREADRKAEGEAYVGAELKEVSCWGKGGRNTLYAANMKVRKIDLSDLVEDPFEPGKGWMPPDLPCRVLEKFVIGRKKTAPAITVWDGFMGRGTIGAACRALGLSYVGLDKDPVRVVIAREYLGL